MRWWDSRLIHEPTTSADAVVVKRSPTVAETARSRALERSPRGPKHDTASAEAVGSWIRRLSHHHMVPCELWDAQSSARRPHRRVWSLRYALGENARRTLRLLWRALATIALHDHIIG